MVLLCLLTSRLPGKHQHSATCDAIISPRQKNEPKPNCGIAIGLFLGQKHISLYMSCHSDNEHRRFLNELSRGEGSSNPFV
jgi:hypothetical protein